MNANAGHQNAPLSGGSIYMREDYDPTVDGNGDYWQRVWESIFGTTHQGEYETVIKDYVVDYLSAANRDILVYEAGSYVQRYVYAANGARLSLELSYAEDTQRGDPGQIIASDIAVNVIRLIKLTGTLSTITLGLLATFVPYIAIAAAIVGIVTAMIEYFDHGKGVILQYSNI